jgi:hypothetical protein
MPDSADPDFHRLVRQRTALIELIMGVCDRAADFATELEAFSHRARNRAVVERMLLEVVGVRDACSEILARLQRQPSPPPEDAAAAEPATPPKERNRPDYLRVVESNVDEPSADG